MISKLSITLYYLLSLFISLYLRYLYCISNSELFISQFLVSLFF